MATVDDLLRRLHHQAALLSVWDDPERQLAAQLRGWVKLAAATRRVVDMLDPHPEGGELYGLLSELRRETTRPGRVDAGIANLALIVGTIADVARGLSTTVASAGEDQQARLQASILAAMHAAARASLDTARAAGHDHAADLFRQVATVTEDAALLPPSARVSTLERLAVTRLTPETADGAVQLWANAATRIFSNHKLATGVSLQEAAATLALLCQISADTLREAARRGVADPDAARTAAHTLHCAAGAWRKAATWPSSIQLGGRAHEHHRAVQGVRAALTGPPLARLSLRDQAHTLRIALDTAVGIGELQVAAVAREANHGGLWIPHERPNLRPPGVKRRHVKLDWDPIDATHPAGRTLTERTRRAQHFLVAAADATHRAIFPSPAIRGESGRIALVEDRIVATWWETAEASRTRKPEIDALGAANDHHLGIPR